MSLSSLCIGSGGSTSIDSSSIDTEQLTVWSEKQIPLKRGSKPNRGVFLGWHYDDEDIKAWKALDSTVKTPVKVEAEKLTGLP